MMWPSGWTIESIPSQKDKLSHHQGGPLSDCVEFTHADPVGPRRSQPWTPIHSVPNNQSWYAPGSMRLSQVSASLKTLEGVCTRSWQQLDKRASVISAISFGEDINKKAFRIRVGPTFPLLPIIPSPGAVSARINLILHRLPPLLAGPRKQSSCPSLCA